MSEENPTVRELLVEISEGRGAFSLDQLKHADNCITNMKELAAKAIKLLDETTQPLPPAKDVERVKTQYVIGFLFRGGDVALIQKNRPEWQKGKLNGIGGYIEKGENPYQAMNREFQEEACKDLNIVSWDFFCTMVFPDYEVHCFKAFSYTDIETETDEKVGWYNSKRLPENVIPNLNWLIPMALQKEEYMTGVRTALLPSPSVEEIKKVLVKHSEEIIILGIVNRKLNDLDYDVVAQEIADLGRE